MICGTSVRGSKWLLWTGLSVACLIAVFVAMNLQERAITAKVAKEVAGVEDFAASDLSASLQGIDLSQPLSEGGVSAALTQQLERGILSNSTVRVRIFATNGILLYSTDEGDRLGAARIGDPDAVRAAAAGAANSIVSDDRVSSDGGNSQSLRLLQVFAPVPIGASEAGSVVEADVKYRPIENASKKPWSTVMLGAAAAAIVFFVLALFGLGRTLTAKKLAARSGFAAQPGDLRKAQKQASKEAKAREALENQLEALRDQYKELQESTTAVSRDAAAKLEAATRRPEAGDGRRPSDGSGEPADADGHEALMRIAEGLANEADDKRQRAEARAEEAENRAADLRVAAGEGAGGRGGNRRNVSGLGVIARGAARRTQRGQPGAGTRERGLREGRAHGAGAREPPSRAPIRAVPGQPAGARGRSRRGRG